MANYHLRLYDIYEKKMHNVQYKYDVHDSIALSAFENRLKSACKGSRSCYFSVVVPTGWDDEIRENFLRPFFVQIGLIGENDHKGRLLFFTTLESNFHFHQHKYFKLQLKKDSMIGYGKECIMYYLHMQTSTQKLSVNLDLFSAQYPPTTSNSDFYVPRVLESLQFDITLHPHVESGLEACFKSCGFDIQAIKTRRLINFLSKKLLEFEVFKIFCIFIPIDVY